MDQTLNNPKPSRWRMLITPWRWPRWLLIILVALMPVAYLTSAVPVIYAIHRLGVHNRPAVRMTVQVIYFPLGWLETKSTHCRQAINWQMDAMVATFGELE